MKMSYHYWQNKGKKSKKGFIALSNSYHGETLGSLSVSNIDLYKKTYESILKDTIIVDSPDSYRKKENMSEEEHAEQMFNKMYKALKDNHRNCLCGNCRTINSMRWIYENVPSQILRVT